MPDVTSHAPGAFSWPELGTTDQHASAAFYAALFGWTINDQPMGPGETYTMSEMRGRPVAAAYTLRAEEKQSGAPPHWNNYVTVASADDAAAKAKELGATLIEEPFDVMGAGRMALLADPAGATLCVWEARDAIGAGRVNEPGALTWNELHTTDLDGASAFYGALFSWTTEPMPTGDGPPYHVISNSGRSNGGITATQPGEPPNWVPYFAVSSVDDALSEANEGGGATLAGPIPMPQGRIAVLRDPQGAVFALWEGTLDG